MGRCVGAYVLLTGCHHAAPLTELERRHVADSLEVEDYADAEVIVRQNDPGRHMYIVETVRVHP